MPQIVSLPIPDGAVRVKHVITEDEAGYQGVAGAVKIVVEQRSRLRMICLKTAAYPDRDKL